MSITKSKNLSRRNMLLIAAGAAGASLFDVAKVLAAGVPGPQKDYGWFPIGIQSYSLRTYNVDEAFEKIVQLGLHQVELYGAHFAIDSNVQNVAPMLKKARRKDIFINGHGVNKFTSDHEANRKIFDFANIAGIRNISADPTPDSFDSLDKLVEEFGIRILIHNHGPDASYDKISDTTRAIKGRHKWIGACADLGHYIRSGEDPIKAIFELGDRLYGIHLKDFAEQKKDTKGVILGRGHLDLVKTFKALRQVRFPADGCLSVEYEESHDNPVPDIRECLAVSSEAALKAMGH